MKQPAVGHFGRDKTIIQAEYTGVSVCTPTLLTTSIKRCDVCQRVIDNTSLTRSVKCGSRFAQTGRKIVIIDSTAHLEHQRFASN